MNVIRVLVHSYIILFVYSYARDNPATALLAYLIFCIHLIQVS